MSEAVHTVDDAQRAEVEAFLGATTTYGAEVTSVERVETHGAMVFLAGDNAYKIKRPVRYSYMDFSTLELRRRALVREYEINRPHAPAIYLGVVAITRGPDGSLAIGGNGEPVEWAVHMRRFDDEALLSRVAERHGIDKALARDIADVVHRYHRSAAVERHSDPRSRLRHIIDELSDALAAPELGFAGDDVRRLTSLCRARLDAITPMLHRRANAGMVRRCHGDLHLGNIVLWHGQPTLFDAIEFDETIATIDTLYDLAFLLMDLDRRGQRAAANVVLNRYLWRTQGQLDLEGLAALPLFLALRAGIRAMVLAQRATLRSAHHDHEASCYLSAATAYLDPVTPQLIAVGGLSGTGKSTLAAALAPSFCRRLVLCICAATSKERPCSAPRRPIACQRPATHPRRTRGCTVSCRARHGRCWRRAIP